jgi:hypothetical protein
MTVMLFDVQPRDRRSLIGRRGTFDRQFVACLIPRVARRAWTHWWR